MTISRPLFNTAFAYVRVAHRGWATPLDISVNFVLTKCAACLIHQVLFVQAYTPRFCGFLVIWGPWDDDIGLESSGRILGVKGGYMFLFYFQSTG